MVKKEFEEYARIVGEIVHENYLGPEQQGELLRRCTILEDVEIGYSSNTHLDKNPYAN